MKILKFTTLLSLIAVLYVGPLCSQIQLGTDIDGKTPHESFGYTVSMSSDGSRVASGASEYGEAGQVRVYEWDGTDWSQVGEGIDGENRGESCGRGLAISPDGQRVAVGAYMNSEVAYEAGEVRIYEWNDVEWVQLGEDINAKLSRLWMGLGESISISGERVAVGAAGPGFGNLKDYVQIYEWNGESWIQLGEDIEGEASGDASGRSVSLSDDGSRVAIGAPDNDGNGDYAGHARVYEWNGESWIQLGEDIDGEYERDGSGTSVSLSSDGKRVAIGARWNDGGGDRSGHVRIFEWDNFEWTQVGKDIDGKRSEDWFGQSVSLASEGDIVSIGGRHNNGGANLQGYTQVYKWNGVEWLLHGREITDERINDFSGHSVSLSSNGNTLAIGAFRNNDNGLSAGHVRVFDLRSITSLDMIEDFDIEIFPNPTQGIIHLVGIESGIFTIVDSFGKVLMSGNILDREPDLSQCASGLYFLQIRTEKGVISKKITRL